MTVDRSVLVQRIANRDEAAMKDLYIDLAPTVRRFLTRWIRDGHEVEDLTHETMLIVWQTAERFKAQSKVKTWVLGIARNVALTRLRSAKRLDLKGEFDDDLQDESELPDEILSGLENANIVRDCVSTLSPAHSRAIHLCFFEDLNYREIAELENCPTGTVKTRIMHAKKLLLRCVQSKMQKG